MSADRLFSAVSRDASGVGLGLIHWNSGTLTRECIESVMQGEVVPDHLVVYNNAAKAGEMEDLVERFPGIAIVNAPDNVGFAAAANFLVEELERRGARYAWILNNDTRVARDALSALLAALEGDSGLGACSGKIVVASDAEEIWYGGGVLDDLKIVTTRTLAVGSPPAVFDVTFLSGCCMLVRVDAMKRVGPFDVTYFAYCEDADWCFRARSKGVRLGYVPRAIIVHEVSASIRRSTLGKSRGTASSFQQFLSFRARGLLIRRHAHGALHKWALLATLWLRGIATIVGQVFLGRGEKSPAVFHGLRCGTFDPFGKSLERRWIAKFAGTAK